MHELLFVTIISLWLVHTYVSTLHDNDHLIYWHFNVYFIRGYFEYKFYGRQLLIDKKVMDTFRGIIAPFPSFPFLFLFLIYLPFLILKIIGLSTNTHPQN